MDLLFTAELFTLYFVHITSFSLLSIQGFDNRLKEVMCTGDKVEKVFVKSIVLDMHFIDSLNVQKGL